MTMSSTAAASPLRRITVAVVESNDLIRDGLVALFASTSDLECIGAWDKPTVALAGMKRTPPDILLLDVARSEHLGTLKQVLEGYPHTRVLVTVDCAEERCIVLNPSLCRGGSSTPFLTEPDDCLQSALKLGARGVLRKQCSFRVIAQAIRTVAGGGLWMEAPTAGRLARQYVQSLHPLSASSGIDSLTLRERQVAKLLSQGRTNKEIAQELDVSYSTVKNYVSNILHKLDLADRTQIALYVVQHLQTDEAAPLAS